MFDRVSLEPSRRCSKGCSFCYNGSSPRGEAGFTAAEVLTLARDCALHGVRSLSLGGGEPLEWPGLLEVLHGLQGVLGRTLTTNGLELAKRPGLFDELARAAPDTVHVSLHAPENEHELARVIAQVLELDGRGVATGVNLLIRRSTLAAARAAVESLEAAGIDRQRTVFLPARGLAAEAPTPADVAWVATGRRAKGPPFQSMSCLSRCGASDRFISIAADRTVAWCSYTVSRRPLAGLRHADLVAALAPLPAPLGLQPCHTALVRTLGAQPAAASTSLESP